jgi:rhamnosyltransferase
VEVHLRVSVVIPTYNAGPTFERLLRELAAQSVADHELIVVDSGSTDGTAELARRYGATVHQIPKSEFDHGGTRNLGISLSRGKYVALIVQDAVPFDEHWLAAMIENLERDEQVAGVYSRQIPHLDAGPLTRVVVNGWATASLERREQYAEEPERYAKLPPMKRRRMAIFNNVSSCIRRSVWEEIPFERTKFGEDIRWSKRAVEAGYKVVYEPRSAVFHSHERGPVYDLRRHYVDQQLMLELFGARRISNVLRLLAGIARSSLYHYRLLHEESPGNRVRSISLATEHAIFTHTGAYLAAKKPTISRLSPRAFEKLDRFLSKGI